MDDGLFTAYGTLRVKIKVKVGLPSNITYLSLTAHPEKLNTNAHAVIDGSPQSILYTVIIWRV
jgi:hypothetical protein